jgi:hypothetical protein
MTLASIFTNFWNDQLVDNSRQGLFLVLLGFVGSFAFIRMSTRIMRSPRISWWPGSVVSEGGVHVHHLVFGNVLMMAAGALGFWFFDSPPWFEICAFLFGIGVGLTLDEFAMLVHLEDVYWTQEGRASIDATVIAVAAMALVFLGVNPFEIDTGSTADVIASIVVALFILVIVLGALFKQRLYHAFFGFFFFPIAVWALCRLGKPTSPWARKRYGERNPVKQAKAEHRFRPDRRTEQIKERIRDIVGGSTESIYEAKLADREAREHAQAQIHQRAEDLAAAENADPRRASTPTDAGAGAP